MRVVNTDEGADEIRRPQGSESYANYEKDDMTQNSCLLGPASRGSGIHLGSE
jgi:hypothetical protein